MPKSRLSSVDVKLSYRLNAHRQSSLYEYSHYEILFIQTFTVKRTPSACYPNKSLIANMFAQKRKRANGNEQPQICPVRSPYACVLFMILLLFNNFVVCALRIMADRRERYTNSDGTTKKPSRKRTALETKAEIMIVSDGGMRNCDI
jgi:hypothetical protein